MSRQLTKYTAKDNVYLIGDWDVDTSLEILVWLTKTFGEGFISIFMSEEGQELAEKTLGGKKTEDKEGDSLREKELILEFTRNITKNLDAKEYVKYAKRIVSGVKCNGKDIDFSYHFVGKVDELHMLMFKVLQRQYGSFLGASIGEE